MKLQNTSVRDYTCFDIRIKAGETLDVENKKACEILLKQEGVIEAVDKKQVENLEKELELANAKNEALELGIKFSPNIGLAKLKEKIAEAKKDA